MEYIYFNSGMKKPFCDLSNFKLVENGLEYNGKKYNSIECLFVSLHYKNGDILSNNGKFGDYNSLWKIIFGDECDKKKKYWMKKDMVGILYKKINGNKKLEKELGLIRKNDFESNENLWLNILRIKYNDKKYKKLLLSTGDKILIEFNRMCKDNDYYCGLVKDGKIIGQNNMGKFIMTIRAELVEN